MCGIAGFIDLTSKTTKASLKPMTDVIKYRGPDSSGEYHDNLNIAHLGIRRLSIIDLKTGDQPIKNEDGSIVVVYNGEIYNFQELKKDLEKKGHKFRTKSDTEVLVHGYEEYDEEFVKKLNGMFAFSLWDDKKKKLLLGRDRIGIKPLYYYFLGKVLVFGSEVKTILQSPLYKKSIDYEAIKLYWYFGFLPGDISMFKGIKKILPGHTLSFSLKGLKFNKYFELSSDTQKDDITLDQLMVDTVKSQLIADVPVGVFLSGGLDSSLLAYYISKFKKLKSFSIGFKEKGFDESEHAHYVAKKIGTEHESFEFSSKDVTGIFSEVSKNLDEPLADASIIPTYQVSKLARKYVKVALSGDGGDELFGGYPTHQAHLLSKYTLFLPKFLLNDLPNIINYIPDTLFDRIPLSFKDYPKKRLASIVAKGMQFKNPQRQVYLMRTFFLGEKLLVEKPDLDFLTNLIPVDFIGDSVMSAQAIDFHTYLRDDFLVKTDRASMFNSLEVRVPYLDNNVINYAFSQKKPHANLFKTKIQLRKLIEEKLPEIAKRPKKGFGIPLEKWLRSDLKDFAGDMLSNKKLSDYVNQKLINKLWQEHIREEANNSGILWQIIVFSGWLNNWI